jgi:hypothetical protein
MRLLLVLFGCAHLCLVLWYYPSSIFISVLSLGCMYDNFVVALVPRPWMALHGPRYVLHAVILPLLIPLAARLNPHGLAWSSPALVSFCVAGLILYGLVTDVAHLKLQVDHQSERVYNAGRRGPPLATIASNILFIVMMWSHGGLAFWGAVFILVINALFASNKQYGFIVGNAAEVVFVACLFQASY